MSHSVGGVLCHVVVRAEGIFEVPFISDGSQDLFGLDSAQISAHPELLLDAIDPRDRPSFTTSLLRSAVELIPWIWEGRTSAARRARWIRASGQAERVPSGDLILEGILVDITERRELELALEGAMQDLARATLRERERSDALRSAHARLVESNRRLIEEQAKVVRAEKLSSIGRLAAGVAHEINNPLTGVMACFRTLRAGAVPPDRIEEYHQTIEEGLDRIKSVSQSLLEFASPQAADFGPIDIPALVRSTLRLAESEMKKKRVRAVVKTRGARAMAHGNRSQLMQAFFNVLLNAVQASPPGSTVEIVTRAVKDRVLIRVLDQGPGIPPELIGRVCDPFFTTKPQGEGTGLGLAVTLGIIEAHRGELRFESQEGRGTKVSIRVPRVAA